MQTTLGDIELVAARDDDGSAIVRPQVGGGVAGDDGPEGGLQANAALDDLRSGKVLRTVIRWSAPRSHVP